MPRKKSSGPRKAKEFVLKPWLIGQIRRACRKYPPYYQTLNDAKEVYYITTKAGKPLKRVKYTCSKCKGQYASKDVRVDHVEPVVPVEGFPQLPNGEPDYNVFLKRMFCSKDGLQVLCTGCHDEKTLEETKQRVEQRKQQRDN